MKTFVIERDAKQNIVLYVDNQGELIRLTTFPSVKAVMLFNETLADAKKTFHAMGAMGI